MNIGEIREILDLVESGSITELILEKPGVRLTLRKQRASIGRRVPMMVREEKECLSVEAPAIGMFYYVNIGEDKAELKKGELESLLSNGQCRIEVNRGLCVSKGQILGTIIQLDKFPIPVKAPCAGIIETVLCGGDEKDQQGYAIGYGEVLFVIRKV